MVHLVSDLLDVAKKKADDLSPTFFYKNLYAISLVFANFLFAF